MINRYLPSYMQGSQIAYPTMEARILSDGTIADPSGNPIQQMTPSGGFGENNAPIFGSYGNQGSMGSLQQGIGSLINIINQNVQQYEQQREQMQPLVELRNYLNRFSNQRSSQGISGLLPNTMQPQNNLRFRKFESGAIGNPIREAPKIEAMPLAGLIGDLSPYRAL